MGAGQRREARRSDWENLGTAHVESGRMQSRRRHRKVRRQPGLRAWWRRNRLRLSTGATVLLVLALGGLESLESFSRIEIPPLLEQPLVPILLTLLILFFAFQSYRQARASLAFYRRFVRPGLRMLLEVEGETLSRGEKLFRGHDAVVMKIDVEAYTFLTYDMPYGVRRLFLDLWYTLVDDVLAREVFFDKSLGDGSLYFFDAESRRGAAGAALEAALRVRDETVPLFDRTFHARLERMLERSPQLRIPSELYFERYRERAGADFWDRRTVVRIALVAGCVDEGLWGLSSQSHYDVQGTPLVVAARLEQAAASGEILLDRSFVESLRAELGDAGLPRALERRELDIRGIGWRPVWVLPPSSATPRPQPVPSRSAAVEAAGGLVDLELDPEGEGAVGL